LGLKYVACGTDHVVPFFRENVVLFQVLSMCRI
jgi:hypothetical protein